MAPQKTRKRATQAARHVPNELAVWLDDPAFGPLTRIGTLSRSGLDSVRFAYDPAWLAHPVAFQLDPSLALSAGDFFPRDSNFGVFLDSCPDRWGQVLMKRRELVEAREQGRPRRELRAWDFLLGVQDFTRMGALRFSDAAADSTPVFLANETLAAPPVTQIGALQQVALELTRKKLDDLALLQQWLRVLVAPGASLGGARPKANLAARDGSIWIAKFPAADDDHDVALWEKLIHDLANRAKITVPPSRIERIGHGYHTFVVQRFDRHAGCRKFFTSAMTLLHHTDSEDAGYLELAEFIASNGSRDTIEPDLQALFRRVVFNVVMANRDDHLRNHGFLRMPGGWRLAPAYDMNPSVRDCHVLALDDHDTTPSLETVLETAPFYRLKSTAAEAIVQSVLGAFRDWQRLARQIGLSAEDIAELDSLFALENA